MRGPGHYPELALINTTQEETQFFTLTQDMLNDTHNTYRDIAFHESNFANQRTTSNFPKLITMTSAPVPLTRPTSERAIPHPYKHPRYYLKIKKHEIHFPSQRPRSAVIQVSKKNSPQKFTPRGDTKFTNNNRLTIIPPYSCLLYTSRCV